jgi:hypothetical protein
VLRTVSAPDFPQLKVSTNDHELLAKAWQAASAKARELGWITRVEYMSAAEGRGANVVFQPEDWPMNFLRSICCLFGGSCPSGHREPTKETARTEPPLVTPTPRC